MTNNHTLELNERTRDRCADEQDQGEREREGGNVVDRWGITKSGYLLSLFKKRMCQRNRVKKGRAARPVGTSHVFDTSYFAVAVRASECLFF